MMPFARLQLKGDKKLIAALNNLDAKVAKKVIRKALRTAGKPILSDAKGNCPVDTGTLRSAIKLRALKRQRHGTIGITIQVGEGSYKGDQFYGAFVEFGHFMGRRSAAMKRTHGAALATASRLAGRKWIPPRPFMAPAFESNGAAARNTALQLIWSGIAAAAEAGAK